MFKRLGEQTVKLQTPPVIISTASIVGKKEGQGPLSQEFDQILDDGLWGEDSWEKAESKMIKETMKLAVKKSNLTMANIDYILTGDLLNQLSASTFGIRDFNRPYFGLFGACSTMGESMSLGAMLVDGGFANNILAGTSSHFCAAEKQFRFPLELGTQRSLTSTWTVTGAGAVVIAKGGEGPSITYITTGKIVDMGVTDSMNMGAAMAPAAADILKTHFEDTGRNPRYYDLIVTGDLGTVGKELVTQLLEKEGYTLGSNYNDCGIMIFDAQKQDTHAGGSGCGCSATTFCAHIYEQMKKGNLEKVLFIPTGAMMSPTSSQQGETIPGIAHALAIENL